MKEHLLQLADRRAYLQRKAAAQRQELGDAMQGIESRVHAVDGVLLKVRPFLRKPILLAGGAALALFMGPRRVLRMAGKAMFVVSAARRLMGLIR